MSGAAILAHQGGWDEMLMVAGPLLVLGALLAVAHRRAHRPTGTVTESDLTEPEPAPSEQGAGGPG